MTAASLDVHSTRVLWTPHLVVGAALAGLPLLLPSALPLAVRLAVAVALAAAAVAAVVHDSGRITTGIALVAWVAVALGPGDGPVAAVAVACGALLRLWCGLPELCRIGRPVLLPLLPDVAAGAAAAGLVLAVADRAEPWSPVVLLAALAGGIALVAAAVARVRA